MKINIDSWHYRICNLVFNYPSNNLCLYFWQVVWSFCFTLFVFICCSIVAVVIVGFLSLAPLSWFIYMPWAFSFASALIWITILIKLTPFIESELVGTKLDRELFDSSSIPRPTVSDDSFLKVIWEWIKAKKQKVRPRLEFVYEPTNRRD